MSKLVQALLSGILFTFLLDAFLFVGIKIHYIDLHEIHLYYNVLFADHQNIYIFAFFTLFIGFIIGYTKFAVSIIGLLFILVLTLFVPSIGKTVGEMLLMQKNIMHKDKKYTYIGDSYYNGRNSITFYDYELKKVIILDKKRLLK